MSIAAKLVALNQVDLSGVTQQLDAINTKAQSIPTVRRDMDDLLSRSAEWETSAQRQMGVIDTFIQKLNNSGDVKKIIDYREHLLEQIARYQQMAKETEKTLEENKKRYEELLQRSDVDAKSYYQSMVATYQAAYENQKQTAFQYKQRLDMLVSPDEVKKAVSDSVNQAFADLQRQKNALNTQLSQASMTANQIDRNGAGSAGTSVLGDPHALRQQIQALDDKMKSLTEFTRQVAQHGDLAGLLAKLEAEQNRSLR